MSVPSADTQATFVATLVDEWIRHGVRHAVVCPGSRSTPLTLALAERPELTVHVRLDERGACFFAVGLSLATGTPALIATTSGTAAAELHPGVVEASYGGVPLIVCTADRPPRLHHVGAPQTIDQARLYGDAARWFFDPGPVREADRPWWRSLARRALDVAVTARGPVHLNLAFDEPLLGSLGTLPAPGEAPRPPARPKTPAEIGDAELWRSRGVFVAGAGAGDPATLLGAADRLGWPVLADPRSGARLDHPAVVASADALLRDDEVRRAVEPETVVLAGRPWASRVVAEFVEARGRAGARVVGLGDDVSDPGRVATLRSRGDPTPTLLALQSLEASAPPGWRARWERLETAAQAALDKALADDPACAAGRATEPLVARHLFAALEPETVAFVASSMPVRDLEWFGAPRTDPPRVLANRGVNGIDGLTSSALGVAAGVRGPVVAVLGDLAFFHDASALVSVSERRGCCTVLVLDNHGGGIFQFLPQARGVDAARFERLFSTPADASVTEVARGFGLPTAEVSTLGELDDALLAFVGRSPLAVVRVVVPTREQNVALHERLHAAVARAARDALA